MKKNKSYFLKLITDLEQGIDLLESIKGEDLERREQQILRLLYYTCGTVRMRIREILGWDKNENGNNKVSKGSIS